jgi:hypothetical protein
VGLVSDEGCEGRLEPCCSAGEDPAWTSEELSRIGTAEELATGTAAAPPPAVAASTSSAHREVQSGQLRPGTRLDNELALAQVLGVSRPTLRRAMEYLVAGT